MRLALVFAGKGYRFGHEFGGLGWLGRLVPAPSQSAWVCGSVWCAYTLTYRCVKRIGARRLDCQCAVASLVFPIAAVPVDGYGLEVL